MLALILGCTDPIDVRPIHPGGPGRTLGLVDERAPEIDTGPDEVVPPNILVIISDDIGVESSACYEDQADTERAPQPTIEGLCQDGLTFTDAWAYPLCSPTRAAMMTGRYGWQTGVGRAIDINAAPLSVSEITVPDVIGGRQNAYIGKWHLTHGQDLSHPNTLGWSHFSGTLAGTLDDYFTYEKATNGVPGVVTGYATSEVVDDALDWIREHDGAPWMVWVGFNAPHTPLHAPPDDLHSYDLSGLDSTTEPTPFFQAMTEAMDTELGRLLDGIDRENTVIIYLGDNGSMTTVNQGAYPQGHGKGTLGEGGVHVPLIMAGPGIPQGEVDAMVHAVDLHVTVLELFGETIPPDAGLDSVSLLPYLEDPDAEPQRQLMLAELFGETVPEALAGRTARTERYKLVRLFAGAERLYDLQEDPSGTVDLLDSELTDEARQALLLLSDYLDQIDAMAAQ